MDQPTEQLIEDYLFERLPKDRKREVEDLANSDQEFRDILDQRRLEVEAMALAEEDSLRSSMSNWTVGAGQEKDQAPPTLQVVHRRRPIRRILSIAAGFLLFIFAGTSFFASSNYGNEAIAGRYAKSRVAGSRGAANDLELEPVKVLMADKKYLKAITALTELEGNSATMLRAEAYLNLQQYDESIREYDTVIASDSQLADEAAFQRALALLAAGRTSEAEKALQEVAEDPINTFSKNAKTVLSELGSFWRTFAW